MIQEIQYTLENGKVSFYYLIYCGIANKILKTLPT